MEFSPTFYKRDLVSELGLQEVRGVYRATSNPLHCGGASWENVAMSI